MISRLSSKCFFLAHHLFFEEISPKFNEKALKYLMDYLYIVFEKAFFRFDIVSTFYLQLYDEITDNEITLAHILSTDKVLVIGSGSIPSTAEHIVKKTDAMVTGIDRDIQAVKRAKQYATQHGLDKKLHIFHADGSEYDISLFDVIFVSYGIQDEEQLFFVLERKMNSKARIIYRLPYDPLFTIQSLPSSISTSFKVKGQKSSPSLGSIISLVLVKKPDTTQVK
ncbi:MAG: hypothetical protein QCI00_06255 [Candidatus Thermoplasmatota archaeon]|nr:hypothetical protein [Candidatus Thermoplasmatota archaeon]